MNYKDWLNQKYRGQEAAAMDAALDTALFWLRREDAASAACSMDDAPTSLEVHDRRYHKKGWKEGDKCEYRDQLKKGDPVDNLMAAEAREDARVGGGSKPTGFLSRKKHDEYRRLMAKKHPELDADKVLEELAKIEDRKIQGDAFQWLMKGAIRLPEDLYKVEQARELATKAKRNPTEWDTPQACINELIGQGHRISEKPITVEELKKNPLMSDYRDEGYGVETFQVDDSREGQALMRRVIDTHWGTDANPWCLLARQGDGDFFTEDFENWMKHNFPAYRGEHSMKERFRDRYEEETGRKAIEHVEGNLDSAWNYWEYTYNALPKRVAFKGGKLLAFMATDGMDYDQAFDDAAYNDAAELSKMLPERYAEYEEWTKSEEGQEEGANFCEWLDNEYPDELRETLKNPPEEWWDRNDESHAGIPVGSMPVPGDTPGRWAEMELKGGKLERNGDWSKGRPGENGYVRWFDNGKLAMVHEDGKNVEWHENGEVKNITTDEFSAHFDDNGRMTSILATKETDVPEHTLTIPHKDGLVEVRTPLENDTSRIVGFVFSGDGMLIHSYLKKQSYAGDLTTHGFVPNDETVEEAWGYADTMIRKANEEIDWADRKFGKNGQD